MFFLWKLAQFFECFKSKEVNSKRSASRAVRCKWHFPKRFR